MINEGIVINLARSRVLPSRIMCNRGAAQKRQIAKRVESALYNYPIWKVNLEQLHPRYGGSILEFRNTLGRYDNPVEEQGTLRLDFVSRINLIEATLSVMSTLQQDFVQQRYLRKTPFKIIAEELSVTERHLYRIRWEIIRMFALSFGMQ